MTDTKQARTPDERAYVYRIDQLSRQNAALVKALRELTDAAEAVARGDDDATPMHLRCIDSGYMATVIQQARAALAAAGEA